MGKGGNWRKQGKGGGNKGWRDEHRPSDIYQQGEEEDLQPPSFMGAASRKRKWELAAEMGLVPAIGWSHAPEPAGPPPGFTGGSGYGRKGGGGGGAIVGKGQSMSDKGRGKGKGNGGDWGPPREKVAPSSSAGKPSARGKGAGGGGGGGTPAMPKKRAKFGAGSGAAAAAAPAAPADPAAEFRDKPFWINLPADEDLPDVLESMPTEALVLCTQNCSRKGVYDKADELLESLLAEGVSEITEHDDPNWDQFPLVGAAVKEVMTTEECYCIMICPQLNCWAVGVGMKAQFRKQAAKAALAITAALQHVEFGQEVDYSDYPVMGDVAEEATNAKLQV